MTNNKILSYHLTNGDLNNVNPIALGEPVEFLQNTAPSTVIEVSLSYLFTGYRSILVTIVALNLLEKQNVSLVSIYVESTRMTRLFHREGGGGGGGGELDT